MLNKIVIAGRLATVPEVKYTPSGKAVCAVAVAVEQDKPDADGQKRTDFINVVFWGTLGEHVGKWWVKGQWIIVDGRLQSRTWTNKKGENCKTWEVVANSAYFCGDKPQSPPERNATTEAAHSIKDFEPLEDNDDVPF